MNCCVRRIKKLFVSTQHMNRGQHCRWIRMSPPTVARLTRKLVSSPYGRRDRAMPSCMPRAGWGVATGSAKMSLSTSRASSRTAHIRRCVRRLIGCVRSIPFRAVFLRHGETTSITERFLNRTAITRANSPSSRTFTSRGSITSGTSELFPSPQSSTTASFPQIAGQLHPHS